MMEHHIDPLYIIVGLSVAAILSYFFNIISHKFNVPSVILLIITGVAIEFGLQRFGIVDTDVFVLLEIAGLVGLVMIVLEAALDLKLRKDNRTLLIKSFVVALVILLVSSFSIAAMFEYMLSMERTKALIHAIPLSIMSSAIIIPSVGNMMKEKKEFMIYESTFSDILGIMMFYMLIDASHMTGGAEIAKNLSLTTLLTVLISIVLSYVMVIVFQNVKGHGRLVLMVCILTLLYAVGKIFHLSSLLLILMFGIILNNKALFFRGYFKRFIKDDTLSEILEEEFKVVTIEASFFIRTIFFILFGMSIELETLSDPLVLVISGMVLFILYFIRYLNLKVFLKTNVYPELFIAPRGLITILLFFAIPAELTSEKFNSGILLMTILSTSLIMMLALMINKQRDEVGIVEDRILDDHFPQGRFTPLGQEDNVN